MHGHTADSCMTAIIEVMNQLCCSKVPPLK